MSGRTDVKTCVSCGAHFGCGAAGAACWCFAVPLSTADLSEVARAFPDTACLCPACLKNFVSSGP